MEHTSTLERVLRLAAIWIVIIFFMFPIFWIFLMSFQTNETILRVPPSVVFEPTMQNYKALITGRLETSAGMLEIKFMSNLWNSLFLSSASVAVGLVLGIPAAYAFGRLTMQTELAGACFSPDARSNRTARLSVPPANTKRPQGLNQQPSNCRSCERV